MPKPVPVEKKNRDQQENLLTFSEIAMRLAEVGRTFYSRGWALGTSGNFSSVVSREPLRLAITSTGIDKGELTPDQIVQIDSGGKTVENSRQPSEEASLHLAIVRLRGAEAVLHTHSVWGTLLSDISASQGGVGIEGYEMLKGLRGVHTHEHREWLPIIENSQDMAALSGSVEQTISQNPKLHGFLLRRHGLYTWGQSLAEAKRHVEILEFLLEVKGRTYGTA
jgi:methylthioribulose-1-phosphate dehydratase